MVSVLHLVKRVLHSDNSGIEQGWLPPLPAIERIEGSKRPNVFFIYGSDAMGGVINIITRKAQKNGTLVYVVTQR